MTSTALLGYVGETNARPVTVEGMEVDVTDRYVMTIDYGDGGKWITAEEYEMITKEVYHEAEVSETH